jgi:long-chain acyl-CoA synthetase
MLVHQLLHQGTAESIAFHGNENITYKQLQNEVIQYRNFFHHAGIQSGDKIGLFSRNSVEFVYSYMAVVSLGAIVVPLNFQLTIREIAFIVQDANMKHLITTAKMELEVSQLIIEDIKTTLYSGEYQPAPDLPDNFSPNSPCVIIYTSGTTGTPKGAVLTHHNLISNAEAFRRILPLLPSDNVLCVLPMYHAFAWTCAVLNALLCGASITILDGFSPKETISAIKDYHVTVIYGVPPIYNVLSRMGEPEDMSGMKYLVSGGASLPEKVARQFYEKYGIAILEGYGLSEASPVVAVNPPLKPKYCSIGKALPGIEVRILDARGSALPPGVVGELTVCGPNIMAGYFNLPEESSRALKNGWLHTGDLAYMDTEGYIYIVDRLKDMIIANGENIYPREIEELLYAYPGIIDAAVVGVPDKLRGQAAQAYIVLESGHMLDKKSIREYLQNNLAAYKIPRDFLQVESLPKNQTGKILKRVLRNEVSDKL